MKEGVEIISAAQRGHRQARPRASAGTRASAAGDTRWVMHQQSSARRPAAMAQVLAWPQSGQREVSVGCMERV